MSDFKPRLLENRVLVLTDKKPTQTEGGIIIPDTVEYVPTKGTVIASGPGFKDLPNQTMAGDTVYFGKFGGSILLFQEVRYLMLRESDILMIEPHDS